MNKILIVGHPQSGYQEVESLLNDCGMRAALPSRREGFTPAEIGATLCKVHKAQPLHQLGADQSIDQVEASPVWHGMALDLMLGNVDQELWGWADPSAVYLLDYWKELDQNITFILVYDAPETMLANCAQSEHLGEEELQQRAHVWQAYNAALLHFYYRNRERCLLVHARQVRQSANSYLQQVRARIGAPLAARKEPAALANVAGNALQTVEEHTGVTALPSDEAALEHYLAQALVSQQPQLLQLYAELQATANLPLAEDALPGVHALQAWRGLSAMHALTRQIADRAAQQQDELLRIRQELEGQQQNIARLTQETQARADQIAQNQQQENEQVLLQLHQAQEELERFYLESQQQKEKLKALEEEKRAASTNASKEVEQENELLLLQLHQVQEELERYYLENQRLKQGAMPTAQYASSAPTGAAERVKRQLAYRLGAVLLQNYRTPLGWLRMPWALRGAAKSFRREKQQKQGQKLPPLNQYRDAHEGQKVKDSLTYRLGTTLMAHAKTPAGWIKLPFALRREIKSFKQKQKQKQKRKAA